MEGMDKLLDKLGFYDLIGVLLPGIIAMSFSIMADKMIFHTALSEYISTNDTFLFLIVSYFVGVLLQELGSIIMKHYDKGNIVLMKALEEKEGKRDSITHQEKTLFRNAIKDSFPEAGDGLNWVLMYDYCKHSGGNSSSAEKDHSVAAMSRSMGLYFGLLSIALFVKFIYIWIASDNFTINYCERISIIAIPFAVILVMGISLLMWYRSFRFYKIRYIRIIRNYYYNYINNRKN